MNKREQWLQSFKRTDPLKATVSPRKTRAVSISVASGKGGVGKTGIALKMALELAGNGYKVLLIDCDYNLSNTLIKLNLPINNKFYGLAQSENSFFESIYRQGNFHLLAGCNGNLDLFASNIQFDKLVIDIINEYEDYYHYIILDSPGGLSKTILNLNAYTQHRIIIVTPDKSSITDSYSLIKLLKVHYGVVDNFLIVNRVASEKQYEKVVKTISETALNFLNCRIKVLGRLNEHENKLDVFDQVLLNDPNSIVHQNFLKILQKFNERHSTQWGLATVKG